MVSKNRNYRTKGENSASSKLTVVQVKEIRRLHKLGTTQRELAKTYNVAQPTISLIVRGKKWAHIEL